MAREGRGARESTPLPEWSLWLMSEAPFVLDGEEGVHRDSPLEGECDSYETFICALLGPQPSLQWLMGQATSRGGRGGKGGRGETMQDAALVNRAFYHTCKTMNTNAKTRSAYEHLVVGIRAMQANLSGP